jgi:hypothetical protein
MTAEIAIINRQAVALAADSAVTIGRERVWKHANKLFSLGPQHDIGIMIYNSGDFIGIPWEVIIKQFRIKCDEKRFASVKDCASFFREFLTEIRVADSEIQDLSITLVLLDFIETLATELEYSTKDQMLSSLAERVNTFTEEANGKPDLQYTTTKKYFDINFKSVVRDLCNDKDIFRFKLDNKTIKIILDACFTMLNKEFESEYSTGIVLAGFGESELLPSIYECVVDGRHGSLLRYWENKSINLNAKNAPAAVIRPFGQTDIAFFFVEGIISKYIGVIEKLLKPILDYKADQLTKSYIADYDEQLVEAAQQAKDNDVIVEEFMDVFAKIRHEKMVAPLLDVITPLPKEEMASLAEALVELTSLRRRIESQLDSVGGPIDVAVISKGDGFIWIKRKHYFNIEMNKDFLYRKKLRVGGRRYENAEDDKKEL